MRNVLTLALSIGALAICSVPSQAAEKDCGSEMRRVETKMPANLDAGKAAMAKAELKIAAEKAASKDEKGCMMHVDNAEKSMK